MNIVYTSSDAYSMCTGVSLLSLLKNNKAIENLNIYILTTDMKKENMAKMQAICDGYNRKLCVINAEPVLQKAKRELNLEEYRGGLNTYARALANFLLPETLDHAVFIDSDTLVCGDISAIDRNIDDHSVIYGVVEIMLLIKGLCREDKKLFKKCRNYINCGILYINLDRWRAIHGDKLISDCLNDKSVSFKVAEQSILNYAFRDYIGVLPPAYNFYTVLHGLSYEIVSRRYKKKIAFTRDEFETARLRPAIIHFVGDYWIRPWYKDNDCYYKELYLEYFRASPWNKDGLEDAPNYTFLFRCYYSFLRKLKQIGHGQLYFLFRYVFVEFLHEILPSIDKLRTIDKRV